MLPSVTSSTPEWTQSPPSVFDIVTGYYPETKPRGDGPVLRPCLVLRVLRSKLSGEIAVELTYGTKNLKTWARIDKDIIIQNTTDLDEMGLAVATRFNLDDDHRIIRPWKPPHFDCWSNQRTPKIGSLLVDYQKEYAWIMMRRQST